MIPFMGLSNSSSNPPRWFALNKLYAYDSFLPRLYGICRLVLLA